jgi:hypothetical protein
MCGDRAFRLGWLTTCWGPTAVVVVVDGGTGVGAVEVLVVVAALAVVEVVDDFGAVVVVVVSALGTVVVVDGFGATVVVVVAAPAPIAPSRGPHATSAAPVKTTRFGQLNLRPIGTLSASAPTPAEPPTVTTRRGGPRNAGLRIVRDASDSVRPGIRLSYS